MKQVIYTNEKGNVKASVRNAIREQVIKQLPIELEDSVIELIPNARGGFSIEMAENSVNGDIIYAEIEIKVNTLHPDVEKRTSKKKTTKKADSPAKDIFEYKAQMKAKKEKA